MHAGGHRFEPDTLHLFFEIRIAREAIHNLQWDAGRVSSNTSTTVAPENGATKNNNVAPENGATKNEVC